MTAPAAHNHGPGGRDISFRPVTRDDFPLLHRWLTNPEVHTWWRSGTRTIDDIEQE